MTLPAVAVYGMLALGAGAATGESRTAKDATLVVGIYVGGGPYEPTPRPAQAQAGTVTVRTRSGKLVAKKTVHVHQTLSLAVAPGRPLAIPVAPWAATPFSRRRLPTSSDFG
jgi:hypothetical protein